MLWKSEKRERNNNYDCNVCQFHKWYENRACYLRDWPGKESYDFTLPIFDDSVHPPVQTGIVQRGGVTGEGVMELIREISDVFPDAPLFELALTYFRQPQELCFTGIADPEMMALIELEATCSKYRALPAEGGVMDQPTLFLEAFSAIRAAENEYYRKKYSDPPKSAQNVPGLPPRRK